MSFAFVSEDGTVIFSDQVETIRLVPFSNEEQFLNTLIGDKEHLMYIRLLNGQVHAINVKKEFNRKLMGTSHYNHLNDEYYKIDFIQAIAKDRNRDG